MSEWNQLMRCTSFEYLRAVKFCGNKFTHRHKDMLKDLHLGKPERKTSNVGLCPQQRSKGWGKRKKNLIRLYQASKHTFSNSEPFFSWHSETFFPFVQNHPECTLRANPFPFCLLNAGPMKARILKCMTNPLSFTWSFQLHAYIVHTNFLMERMEQLHAFSYNPLKVIFFCLSLSVLAQHTPTA